MTDFYALPEVGLATPLGLGKRAVAAALFAGSDAGLSPRDDILPGLKAHFGAVTAALPPVAPALAAFDCRNNRLLLAALDEIRPAIAAAIERYGGDRIGIVIGTSTSGIAEGEQAYAQRKASGHWPNHYDYRQQEISGPALFLARHLDLTGPAFVIATACSSSAKAFASARRLLRADLCDAVIVGGADSLCGLTAAGFHALESVAKARCNPFSRNRDGINIGEAAVLFLMTREGAPVGLTGLGESSDAHHVSAPDPTGRGAIAAIAAALTDAGRRPEEITYINLHGTATPLNDSMEAQAVHGVFGAATPCSSTKSLTGHTLGAAGALEAAFLWLTLHPDFNPAGRLPPQLWDGETDPALPSLALVAPDDGRKLGDGRAALSNSFAFGGSNAALILERRP